MKIFLNEKPFIVKKDSTAFQVKNSVKKDSDVIVLNGIPIKEDKVLKEKDNIVLIKKGEIPNKEELENILVCRHTPGVHQKVKKSSVAIVGLGGLGSNVAISLARVGIGKLLLIDFDVVEPSNLNRQQYYIKHIGMLKTEAVKELLKEINPFVEIEIKNIYVDESNIEECFKDVDIIVECLDNPHSKAILVNNVLSKFSEKPIVAASGMAGYFSNNTIKTKRITSNFYLIGDETSEVKQGCGLMAPRVAIAANHQANTVLRLILGEKNI